MNLNRIPIAKSLNKAYLKQSLKREQIELFKGNLARLFDRIRAEEHEEHLKNIVADFLKDTWYKPAFEINTSKRADLVMHNGKSSDDTVGVIIETKKPSNKNEMITPERPICLTTPHPTRHRRSTSVHHCVARANPGGERSDQTSEVFKTSEVSPAAEIPQLEAEIDHLVYALYNLTDEKIALVEGKKP